MNLQDVTVLYLTANKNLWAFRLQNLGTTMCTPALLYYSKKKLVLNYCLAEDISFHSRLINIGEFDHQCVHYVGSHSC